jgi:hypothetical protein
MKQIFNLFKQLKNQPAKNRSMRFNKTRNAIPYLQSLTDSIEDCRQKVEKAIKEKGYWEEIHEWRIMTDIRFRIEPVQRNNKTWFKVTVSNDYEMTCCCPTIERAVNFMGIYKKLIMDLFWTFGWPGWVDIDQVTIDKKN